MSEQAPKPVKYVQVVRKPNGTVHLYFRRGNYREGPLASALGTPELVAEVAAIVARLDERLAPKPRAGTVGALLEQYERSARYLGLAASTRIEYGRMIAELREDCAGVLLPEVTADWLSDMLDAWTVRGYKAANDRRQILKNALLPAIKDGRVPRDPFAMVDKLARPHDAGEAHPYWEDAEVDAAIAWALARGQPGLARAVALGRWGGFRRGTICAIPLHARPIGYDRQGNPVQRLHWVTEKRQVLADKREDPRLTALLAATPNRALTIAYNADGQPWKARQLNQAIDRLVTRLAKAGKMRAGLTLHGLRHARGVELAMAGASDAEIMSQLEHASDAAARIYRRQAQRRDLADAGQDRVDAVVQLAERRRAAEAKASGNSGL